MPGNIVDVLVKEGDMVKAGQAVLITEAMKMETEVQAAIAGKVVAIHVAKGDRVTPGEILIEIEADLSLIYNWLTSGGRMLPFFLCRNH